MAWMTIQIDGLAGRNFAWPSDEFCADGKIDRLWISKMDTRHLPRISMSPENGTIHLGTNHEVLLIKSATTRDPALY
jgi:hypothetical protein